MNLKQPMYTKCFIFSSFIIFKGIKDQEEASREKRERKRYLFKKKANLVTYI